MGGASENGFAAAGASLAVKNSLGKSNVDMLAGTKYTIIRGTPALRRRYVCKEGAHCEAAAVSSQTRQRKSCGHLLRAAVSVSPRLACLAAVLKHKGIALKLQKNIN